MMKEMMFIYHMRNYNREISPTNNVTDDLGEFPNFKMLSDNLLGLQINKIL